MKNKISISITGSICLLFVLSIAFAQKRGKEDSKIVAYKFLDAMEKFNFKEAKIYASTETDELLDMYESMNSMLPDSIKNNPSTVKIIRAVEKDNHSTVIYTLSKNPSLENTLKLDYIDKHWEAIMTKDDE